MTQYRTLIVPQDETLAALSTDVPPRPYSFASWFVEWVLSSQSLRTDVNIEHLFDLQKLIEDSQHPGDKLRLTEDQFQLAKSCAKMSIDTAMTPNAKGQVTLIYPWSMTTLRHYHSFIKASIE